MTPVGPLSTRVRIMADGVGAELIDAQDRTIAEGYLYADVQAIAQEGETATGIRFIGTPPRVEDGEVKP